MAERPMRPDELDAYLARIAYDGPRAPRLEVLRALHRAHLASIPFEALDAQHGIVPAIGREAIFAKLVTRKRGGWCYEMNGLFGWALAAMGFAVMRIAAGVMEHVGGAERAGTHLALLVSVDGKPWLADVGFGSSLAEPIPLAEGRHAFAPFDVSLTRLPNGRWRFSEHSGAEAFSFDFSASPADEGLMAEKCAWQASAAQSVFVQNLTARKREGDALIKLTGRVLTRRTADGEDRRELGGPADLQETLNNTFGIDLPSADDLWPRVAARHAELFGES